MRVLLRASRQVRLSQVQRVRRKGRMKIRSPRITLPVYFQSWIPISKAILLSNRSK